MSTERLNDIIGEMHNTTSLDKEAYFGPLFHVQMTHNNTTNYQFGIKINGFMLAFQLTFNRSK